MFENSRKQQKSAKESLKDVDGKKGTVSGKCAINLDENKESLTGVKVTARKRGAKIKADSRKRREET